MLAVVRADEMMVALAAYGIFGDAVPYAAAVDRYGEAVRAFGVERFPTIFVLDREGHVRYVGHEEDVNSQLEQTGSDIDRVVDALLEEANGREPAELRGVKGYSARCARGRS